MSPPYDLLVFDWDGTLLDSVGAIVACTQRSMRELGMEPLCDAEIRGLIGLGLRETVEGMCPGCDDELFRRVLATYRSVWVETYAHRPVLFPGVVELLENTKAEGYLLAVATAKTRRGLDRDLAATRLDRLFDATRTVDEALSKPHPKMLLDLLDELGVAAERALMVGDTVHDLEMAANAGVAAVGVTGGAAPREALAEVPSLALLDSVSELPRWLDQRPSAGGAATARSPSRERSA